MEERILEADKLPDFRQLGINYKILFSQLSRKYPTAFYNFSSFKSNTHEDSKLLINFIESYRLILYCKMTNPIKQYLVGTFSYKVNFDDQAAKKLNRQTKEFSYYGLKSLDSAFEKGIDKCFQIIDCLLTDKELSEQPKKR